MTNAEKIAAAMKAAREKLAKIEDEEADESAKEAQKQAREAARQFAQMIREGGEIPMMVTFLAGLAILLTLVAAAVAIAAQGLKHNCHL